ncbi:MAG: DUF3127 domain-containing protein [Paramuribaculum sp.]|nr:DUF3127 domain-containing protein [Paramuribaculum sp.]
MELTGKVIVVLPIESGTSKSGNAWQKQNFVIETAGQYPKKVCLQLFGDKVNECPNVGDDVKVSFDPESREWQGRWFTQLNAWKVEKQNAQPTAPAPQQATAQAAAQPQGADDELPF